jgi:hypothetical protein
MYNQMEIEEKGEKGNKLLPFVTQDVVHITWKVGKGCGPKLVSAPTKQADPC